MFWYSEVLPQTLLVDGLNALATQADRVPLECEHLDGKCKDPLLSTWRKRPVPMLYLRAPGLP